MYFIQENRIHTGKYNIFVWPSVKTSPLHLNITSKSKKFCDSFLSFQQQIDGVSLGALVALWWCNTSWSVWGYPAKIKDINQPVQIAPWSFVWCYDRSNRNDIWKNETISSLFLEIYLSPWNSISLVKPCSSTSPLGIFLILQNMRKGAFPPCVRQGKMRS